MRRGKNSSPARDGAPPGMLRAPKWVSVSATTRAFKNVGSFFFLCSRTEKRRGRARERGISHAAADLASCPRFGACPRCLAALDLTSSFVEAKEPLFFDSTTPPERELRRRRGRKARESRGAFRLLPLFAFCLRQKKNPTNCLFFFFLLLSFASPFPSSKTGRALVPVR